MNEIIVTSEAGTLVRYVEHPQMISGDKFAYLMGEIDEITSLPLEVREIFKVWEKFSNLEGENGTLLYRSGGFLYKFINHYWD